MNTEARRGRTPSPDERARKRSKKAATRRAGWFAAAIAGTANPFAQLWHACRYAQAVGKALADPAAVRALARDIAGAADERNKQWLR